MELMKAMTRQEILFWRRASRAAQAHPGIVAIGARYWVVAFTDEINALRFLQRYCHVRGFSDRCLFQYCGTKQYWIITCEHKNKFF